MCVHGCIKVLKRHHRLGQAAVKQIPKYVVYTVRWCGACSDEGRLIRFQIKIQSASAFGVMENSVKGGLITNLVSRLYLLYEFRQYLAMGRLCILSN